MKNSFYLLLSIVCTMFFAACDKEDDEDQIVVPAVHTESVEVLGDQLVHAAAIVSDDGGGTVTARGFCWSVSPDPRLENASAEYLEGGTGSFSTDIDGLVGGNTYFLRAFARNEAGTGYGNVLQFSTQELEGYDYFGATIYLYPEDILPHFVWGPTNQFIGATSPGYGSGNTSTISFYSTPSAAKKCSQLEAFGHTDWYLPAYKELEAVYENQDITGNLAEEIYWSSTEVDSTNALAVNFLTGDTLSMNKYSQHRCRCIRKDN